jgi:dihydrofolate synthase/folylpolyglutamate synthase
LNDWLKWQESLHWSTIDLGLERIRQVAENMALFDLPYTIITVAGTNGKGSSVALLDAILSAQGYKTAAYTSPYINHYNERIKVMGDEASDALLCDAFQAVDEARGVISLTYFEFGTLAAIWVFKQQKVEVALLEVGMGGRLDAVNAWDADAALITTIDLDHMEWLGDNREAIGREKAGIMRSDMPVISGDPDVPQTIAETANHVGAILYQVGRDYTYTWKKGEHEWSWSGWRHSISALPLPALSGAFQVANAANVIAVLMSLTNVLTVSHAAICQGLREVVLAGRIELVRAKPDILLDATHNPQAAKQLCCWLNENPVQGKTIALFSMLKDKDIAKVVALMQGEIDHWLIIPLLDERGLAADDLRLRMEEKLTNKLSLSVCDTMNHAWEKSKKSLNQQDRLVVFGSFLLLSKFNVILSE